MEPAADVPDDMKSDPSAFPPEPAPVKKDEDDPDGMNYLVPEPFVTRALAAWVAD